MAITGCRLKRLPGRRSPPWRDWGDTSIKTFLDDLGTTLMGIGGGAAGPLWGTLFGGLALPLRADTQELDAAMLKAVLGSALEEMQSITTGEGRRQNHDGCAHPGGAGGTGCAGGCE